MLSRDLFRTDPDRIRTMLALSRALRRLLQRTPMSEKASMPPLALLEEERARLVKRYAEEQGIGGEVCLTSLAEAAKDDEFHNLRLRLASMVQSISELNEYNRILAERSLCFARNAVGLLTSLGVGSAFDKRAPIVVKEV